MARKAKKGVLIPSNVDVKIQHNEFVCKGDKGENKVPFSNNVTLNKESETLFVEKAFNSKQAKADVGLYHALIQNAVDGVSKGFEQKLFLSGVGYRMIQKGSQVELQLGFSHPIITSVDSTVKLTVVSPTELSVSGHNLQEVTSTVSKIMSYRSALKDPYKQKGVRREFDKLRKKQGKKVK